MKKLTTQFHMVGLEEVFKSAVEVNGTPILENPTALRRSKPQLQPSLTSLKNDAQPRYSSPKSKGSREQAGIRAGRKTKTGAKKGNAYDER